MTSSSLQIAENVFIVLGIASFWPPIFGYMPLWLVMVNVLVALGLVWVAVRRVRRFKKALKEQARIASNTRQGPARP